MVSSTAVHSVSPSSTFSHTRSIGYLLSGIPALFLMFDSVIKLMRLDVVAESFTKLGYPVEVAAGLGVLELVCLVLYLTPRTSVLGAVLLTAYLGGAIASHMRIGSPLPTHVLFPTYVGLLIWGGLYLRDARVRALVAGRG